MRLEVKAGVTLYLTRHGQTKANLEKRFSGKNDTPLTELGLDDFAAALIDLQLVVAKDPKYDFHRAIGLLAHAHGRAGDPDKADAFFKSATAISTLSETYYNYATYLAGRQQTAEAREWAERILAKKPTMPRYLRRRERPWFRKANALLKQLRAR